MTTLAFLASVVAIATIAVGAHAILQICRGNEKLNRDQRNGYKLPAQKPKLKLRTAPKWLEDETWKETRK